MAVKSCQSSQGHSTLQLGLNSDQVIHPAFEKNEYSDLSCQDSPPIYNTKSGLFKTREIGFRKVSDSTQSTVVGAGYQRSVKHDDDSELQVKADLNNRRSQVDNDVLVPRGSRARTWFMDDSDLCGTIQRSTDKDISVCPDDLRRTYSVREQKDWKRIPVAELKNSNTNLHTSGWSPNKQATSNTNLHTSDHHTPNKQTTSNTNLHTSGWSPNKQATSNTNLHTSDHHTPNKQTTSNTNLHTSGWSPNKLTTLNTNLHTSDHHTPNKQTTLNTNLHTSDHHTPNKLTTSNTNLHTSGSSPNKQTTSNTNLHTSGWSPNKQTTSNTNLHTSEHHTPNKQTTSNTNLHTSGSSPNKQTRVESADGRRFGHRKHGQRRLEDILNEVGKMKGGTDHSSSLESNQNTAEVPSANSDLPRNEPHEFESTVSAVDKKRHGGRYASGMEKKPISTERPPRCFEERNHQTNWMSKFKQHWLGYKEPVPKVDIGGSDSFVTKLYQDRANICVICIDIANDPKTLDKCRHVFCRCCIDKCFQVFKPVCPICNTIYGVVIGNQPVGQMLVKRKRDKSLPGHPDCGTIEITYLFKDGIQGVSDFCHIHPAFCLNIIA